MIADVVSSDMGRLVINRGLDRTADEAWAWYREVRSAGDPAPVLREHVLELSRGCDDIVRSLYPDQDPFYLRVAQDRIARLEQSLENSAPR